MNPIYIDTDDKRKMRIAMMKAHKMVMTEQMANISLEHLIDEDSDWWGADDIKNYWIDKLKENPDSTNEEWFQYVNISWNFNAVEWNAVAEFVNDNLYANKYPDE